MRRTDEETTIDPLRRRAFLAAAAAAALVVTGCSGGTTDERSEASGSSGDPAAFSMVHGLEQLPLLHGDAGRSFIVTFTDVDAATRLAGTRRPTTDGQGAQRSAWAQGFQGQTDVNVFAAPYVGWEQLGTGQVSRVLGFSVPQVRWYATSSVGRSDTTVEQLMPGTTLNPDLPTSGGVTVTGPGKVGQVDQRRDAQGGAFPTITGVAEHDGLVAMSNDTNVLQAWEEQSMPSMATVAPVAGVARELDARDAYAGQIVSRPPVSDPQALTHPRTDPRITEPIQTVGVGATLERARAHAYVVYRFTGDAAEGQRQVRRVWTDGISGVENKPLTTYVKLNGLQRKGPLVIADLSPVDGGPINVFMMSVYGDVGFRNVR